MNLITRMLMLIALILLLVAGGALINGLELREAGLAEIRQDTKQLARIAQLDMVRVLEGTRQLLATLAKLPADHAWDERACSIIEATASNDFEYDHLVAVDHDGIVRCNSSGFAAVGTPMLDRDLFDRVMSTGAFSVGSYGKGRVSNNEVLRVGYPVTDVAGIVIGLVYAGINLTWLNTAIAEWRLGEEASIDITDRNGMLIARHPNPHQVGQPVSDRLKPFLVAGDIGTAEVTEVGGVPRLYGYVPTNFEGMKGLAVFVGIDQTRLFAGINRSIWANFAAVSVLLLLAGLSSILYVRRFLARPFQTLLSAVESWRDGDWSVRTGARSGVPEFDRLTSAFDELAAAVSAGQTQITRQNRAIAAHSNVVEQLATMVQPLQSCSSNEEIADAVGRFAPQILPGVPGALCLFSNSRNLLRIAATWNAPAGVKADFPPADCWGLRRGQPHAVTEVGGEVICAHVDLSKIAGYCCRPLTAHGETLGLLYLETAQSTDEPESADARHDRDVFAENISLALGNQRLHEKLRDQSIRDPLTGLFNRRYLEEVLELDLARATRGSSTLSLIMGDIDHFKNFNDRFGHDAGDFVLKRVAETIQSETRRGDVVCRYGGEEFLILLPGANLAQARERAEMLRRAVKSIDLSFHGQALGAVTISLGIAGFPNDANEGATLITAADAAMYSAKCAGRDRVCSAHVDVGAEFAEFPLQPACDEALDCQTPLRLCPELEKPGAPLFQASRRSDPRSSPASRRWAAAGRRRVEECLGGDGGDSTPQSSPSR